MESRQQRYRNQLEKSDHSNTDLIESGAMLKPKPMIAKRITQHYEHFKNLKQE